MADFDSEKYDKVFIESFAITKEQLNEKLEYSQIAAWDSVGHMAMVDELERAFNITFDADDIVSFSSYLKGKDILKKYGVNLR